jgi:serine/threonine protein kinase
MDKKGVDAVLKLCDFGMAKYAEVGEDFETKNEMSNVGTNCYMSPEMKDGHGYDVKTDLWGLGVILLDMLVGSRLWQNPKKFRDKFHFVTEYSHGRVDL